VLQAGCRDAGIEPYLMASGAGHDAATFAHVGIPAAMIFVRNEHGSHNPDEFMDMADFDCALGVLVNALKRPAEEWLNA
jgi:N-carbamoyl-L-amino-acid hydrolase